MSGERKWWEDRDNLILLTAFMARHDYSAEDVAYAVEKPWKFELIFDAVKAEVEE